MTMNLSIIVFPLGEVGKLSVITVGTHIVVSTNEGPGRSGLH